MGSGLRLAAKRARIRGQGMVESHGLWLFWSVAAWWNRAVGVGGGAHDVSGWMNRAFVIDMAWEGA